MLMKENQYPIISFYLYLHTHHVGRAPPEEQLPAPWMGIEEMMTKPPPAKYLVAKTSNKERMAKSHASLLLPIIIALGYKTHVWQVGAILLWTP